MSDFEGVGGGRDETIESGKIDNLASHKITFFNQLVSSMSLNENIYSLPKSYEIFTKYMTLKGATFNLMKAVSLSELLLLSRWIPDQMMLFSVLNFH